MERGFDDIVKKVYDSGEFEYKPGNWLKLKEKLNEKDETKKGFGLFLASGFTFKKLMAASIVAIIGIAVLYHFMDQSKEKEDASNSNIVNISSDKPIVDSALAPPQSTTNKPDNHTNIIPQSNSISHTPSPTQKNIPSNRRYQSAPNFNLNSTLNNEKVAATSTQKDSSIKRKLVSPIQESATPTNSIVSNNNLNKPVSNFSFDDDIEKNRSIRKGFTLIGGYGKGVSNSMYFAGMSYTLPISNHVFIESDVAYSSSNIQNVVTLGGGGASSNTMSAGPATNGALSPDEIKFSLEQATTKHIAFAHLAFNPTIGYVINKRFAIKAGIDAQHQITNKDAYGYTASDAMYKPLPKTDIGFTPKIAIQLNKHWQSNLIYRKAINHLFSKIDYFNRDYFQLQLGYKF